MLSVGVSRSGETTQVEGERPTVSSRPLSAAADSASASPSFELMSANSA